MIPIGDIDQPFDFLSRCLGGISSLRLKNPCIWETLAVIILPVQFFLRVIEKNFCGRSILWHDIPHIGFITLLTEVCRDNIVGARGQNK
jgi:hypothetical protein